MLCEFRKECKYNTLLSFTLHNLSIQLINTSLNICTKLPN